MAASDFCTEFEAALGAIAGRAAPASGRSIILSGGVDTCAILAAAQKLGITFAAAITVITGEDCPDKEFAAAAAAEHSLPHYVVHVTPKDLVETYLPACVQKLHTFDGMTLRNSLVVAAAFCKASDLGFSHVVVGDGADELFGGYSFMWGCADNPALWKEKRDKMCANWTFATGALAASYGLTSYSPYMEPNVVEWAITHTARSDCIGSRPIRLVLGGEAIEHETGKLVLREAYNTISSWRRKDPIEVGSGITIIGHDPFWSEIISDDEFASARDEMLARGFVIKNKEHLVNFRIFEVSFGQDGAAYPKKRREPLGYGCAGCCFEIGESTFCEVCGAYPAQRSPM